MASKVHHVPVGYHTAIPYLIVKGAAKALEYYKKAFGTEEIMRFTMPDGQIGHAEIKIGDSTIMLADENAEMGVFSPPTIGGSPVAIMIYVPDVDAFAKRAVAAGGKLTRPIEDKFYGDRAGSLTDPFGHHWHIATHKEDVSPDEMKKRAEKLHSVK
jgi:PhnB protein